MTLDLRAEPFHQFHFEIGGEIEVIAKLAAFFAELNSQGLHGFSTSTFDSAVHALFLE